MKQHWEYAGPVFEADRYDETILKYSPWSGHRRFAYDLVSYYEPEIIVELGSFYGCSSFAFMQAIKDHGLQTHLYAVDLWEAGDTYTLHDYEQDIYGFFKKVNTEVFGSIQTEMMKMSFDHACQRFKDGTIDLLHIDGSHSYQDVKHDFRQWISKMKQDAIVLFHDISEQMLYGEAIGSSVFWNEIKKEFPYTAQMPHSFGLGILFLDKEKFQDFQKKVDLSYYQNLYLYEGEENKDRIRKDYFHLKDAQKWIAGLKKDKQEAEADIRKLMRELEAAKQAYEKTIQEKDVYIQKQKDQHIFFAGQIKADYEKTIQGKEDYIESLQEALAAQGQEAEKIRSDYESTLSGKEAYIAQLKQEVENWKQEAEKIRRDYEHTIEGKEAYIQKLEAAIRIEKPAAKQQKIRPVSRRRK